MKGSTVICLFSLLFCMAGSAAAASAPEIDAKANQTLQEFYRHSPAGQELTAKAAGVLIFPEVYKAGIGIGGEYGEGALRLGGKTIAYYNVAAASIGFQLGAQIKSEIILFMTQDALRTFRASDGWEAGVDGSVAIATLPSTPASQPSLARNVRSASCVINRIISDLI